MWGNPDTLELLDALKEYGGKLPGKGVRQHATNLKAVRVHDNECPDAYRCYKESLNRCCRACQSAPLTK